MAAQAEQPVPTSTETHWEKAAKTRMGKYLTNIEADFIRKSIELSQQHISVMDVGAETGRFSLLAANGRADVVSVDIDSYSLKRLKHKNSQVNIIQADARKLPLIDEVFDVILMIEVLDYIPELQTALAECKRTLKSNATGFLSFGNKSSAKAKLRALHGKSYRHSYKEVILCLSKVGFNVKKKMGYSWMPFGRTSQSPLVPILAFLERVLWLRKIVRFSPWVIIQVGKPQ